MIHCLAVTEHAGCGDGQFLEGSQRPLSTIFLDKTQNPIEQNDRDNGNGIDPFLQPRRDDDHSKQDPDKITLVN